MTIKTAETVVITCNRQDGETYLDQLISSYGPHPLTFMAGSPSSDNRYLDKYRDNHLYKIIEQEYFHVAPRINCNLNWFRALYHFSGESQLLTIEDDVVFTSDWQGKLDKTLYEITHSPYLPHPSHSFMLSLYRGSKLTQDGNKSWIEVPHREFFGSLGLFWYNVPLGELAGYLWEHGVERYEKPIDLLVPEWLESKGIPIYVTFPSLIQHTGRISTIGSKWTEWCQAESFVP